MSAPIITDPKALIPTMPEVAKILQAKKLYDDTLATKGEEGTKNIPFKEAPWGIAYLCSKANYDKIKASAASKGWDKHRAYKEPAPKNDLALRCFIIAVILGWEELIKQLKRNLKNWGYSAEDIQQIAKEVWLESTNAQLILDTIAKCEEATDMPVVEQLQKNFNTLLNEAVEKHDTLNAKLFTKDETLKEKVKNKMLEIVDEFIADLKEQNINIKIDDVILIGSNASYNYTKDSDIDLHILANAKASKYEPEVCQALYSAYRSLFNKQLEIKLFDIPLEIFVETEDSPRVSNGVYSVKKDKWIKKPVHEDIPDYDKEALKKLTTKWQDKCDKLINDIKADKLADEKKVVKLIEEIYEKLRKKGVAKSEYALENLAFKELRNDGYLDKLKDYRNELVSKRLSLEERLDRQAFKNVQDQIAQIAGSQPIIQDNGMFFIYNVKASEINSKVQALRKLPFIAEVSAHENGKYDFSQMMRTQLPTKYFDIRGYIIN